jgi:hypothetical protein
MFVGGKIVTESSNPTPVVMLICVLGLNTACMTGKDVAVSEPNDVAAAQQPVTSPEGSSKSPDIALPSNDDWEVYSSRSLEPNTYLGNAQLVCANSVASAGCPAEAVQYNLGGSGWAARIDACGGQSRWIWAPGVTAESTPAEMAEYYFATYFSVSKRPATALVHLAVDDQAEVIVNGTAMGTVGSTSDYGLAWGAHDKPTTIDIKNALITGRNTITIRAANGAGGFAVCSNCTYQQHPAGVVACVDVWYKQSP